MSSAAELLEEYPYFTYAAFEMLRSADSEESRGALKARIAAAGGDLNALAEILGLNSASLTDFYPDSQPPQLSTSDTIDTFLAQFGTPAMASGPASGGLGDDPLYAAYVASQPYIPGENLPDAEDETPTKTLGEANVNELAAPSTQALGEANVNEHVAPAPAPVVSGVSPVKEPAAPQLSEGLVRIMVKNGNFAKALEILEDLNLKNPEKSIYFADQMRFLKKLILNQKASKRK